MDGVKYTLEETIKAKEELIKLGKLEKDFYPADELDAECGFLLGEPLLHSEDDFIISAYNLYTEKLFWEEHEDEWIDYMMEKFYE